MGNELLYGMALSLIKGVGDANAKLVMSYAGSAEAVFKTPVSKLQKINGIGPKLAETFKDTREALHRAEEELSFLQKNAIDLLFYYDKRYPKRLLNCPDSPLFIFSKGKVDFNAARFVDVVGTRHATEYGKYITEKLIADLAAHQVSLVSGLAYGIDICAHRAALQYDMQNIAVLAHGLDRVYPHAHKNIAERLQENGALISDFMSGTIPDRQNFPSRNRIVAGMTDATIVVESAEVGGALITAEIANNYNRDVFAFPGSIQNPYAAGCHRLVKTHKANLVTCAQDIFALMNWENQDGLPKIKHIQPQLFIELNEQEPQVCHLLQQKNKVSIDDLQFLVPLQQSVLSAVLLQLELKGVIQSLPGKYFQLT